MKPCVQSILMETLPEVRALTAALHRVSIREGRRAGHRDRLLHPLHQCLRQAGPERVRSARGDHPRTPPEEDLRLTHSGQGSEVTEVSRCPSPLLRSSVWLITDVL